MKRNLGVIVAVFGLTGCATPQSVNTASGHPEVLIHVVKKTVINVFASAYTRTGYQIKTVNDYSLVAEKPSTSLGSAILFGSQFATTPNQRITLGFAEAPDGTLVTGRLEMVTNPGSGYESVTEVSNTPAFQKDLEDFKTQIEAHEAPAIPAASTSSMK